MPYARLVRLSCIFALALAVIPLAGCPEEKAAQSRATTAAETSRANAATLRADAAMLPDTDSRKVLALNAADQLDRVANELTLGVSQGTKAAASDKGNADIASTIGNAIPVPWVGTAVTGVVAGLLGIQSQRRGKALDEKTDEADAVNAQAAALIHSFEAAKTVPAFAAALPQAAPLINAIQNSVPGTRALVDDAQKVFGT